MIQNTIRTCFPIAAAAVAEKSEEINKLNVFPVPDGDTGTNMSLTLNSVAKELAALPEDADMKAVAGAITHGSLMGARGNSGVITSQILRGLSEGFVDAKSPVGAADVAAAFRRSVKVAFQAVRKPVEGTILTVLRDISTRADACEKERATLQETLDAIVVEAYQSVARTPDLLPVLKENGVVDSGAFGFSIFIENFVAAVLGRETAAPEIAATFESTGDAKDEALSRVRIEANDDWEGSEYRYCNEFLFKAEKPFDEDEALAHLATRTCTPTSPTACSSTCSSSARSTRSSSTTWTWSPMTARPRSTPTRTLPPRRPQLPPSRSASWRLPPVPARPTF